MTALVALLLTASAADAQTGCQTNLLGAETDRTGELEASDCTLSPLRNANGEYWRLPLTAADLVVVTIRPVTMFEPYVIILDPSNQVVATASRNFRAVFTASVSGDYRAVATTFYTLPTTDFGTYVIRAERVTTPTAPFFFPPTVLGSSVSLFWSPPLSPSPILEYLLEVGSASGGQNIGVFPVGTVTQVVASASPGAYFVRVRARNLFGLGVASEERQIIVGPELSPPRSLTASVLGRRVTLNWLGPSTPGATFYELLVGSAPGLTDLGTLILGLQNTFSADNVPSGRYYVRVRAWNARGPGAESNEVVVLVF